MIAQITGAPTRRASGYRAPRAGSGPGNAQVYATGTALFGKRSQVGRRDEKSADGPVVRITGRSVFGHVRVMREFTCAYEERL